MKRMLKKNKLNVRPSLRGRGKPVSMPAINSLSATAAPLYEKVKLYVLEMIESGKWSKENRLPGEPELARQLGISRMTINRALRELANESIVDRIPGVGTFVSRGKPASAIVEIHNIADVIRGRGQTYSCDVIQLASVVPPRDVRAGIEVPAKAKLFRALIVHRADGIALQLEDRYVMPDFAPEFLAQDFTAITTTQYLSAITLPTAADHVIEAMLLDAASRELLEMPANEPALVVTRRTWVGDQLTTYMKLSHPGSRYRLIGRTTNAFAAINRRD
jgi:GntR family histidine utilization transcriptional repressor